MYAILLVVAMSVMGVLGDFFVKLAGHGPSYVDYRWLAAGAGVYALSTLGWFFAMKSVKLSILGVVYALTTALLLAALGVFYFDERLHAQEVLGVSLAVVAILLLHRVL